MAPKRVDVFGLVSRLEIEMGIKTNHGLNLCAFMAKSVGVCCYVRQLRLKPGTIIKHPGV